MVDNDNEEIFHDGDVIKQEAIPLQKVVRMTKQDHALLAILLEDEDIYFMELDKQLGKRLHTHLEKLVRDEDRKDIDDFVQITFVRFYMWILKQRKTAKTIQVNHNSYLRAIATHVYDDEVNKRKKLPTQSLDRPVSNVEENTNSSLADQQVDPHGSEWQERKMFLDKVRDTIEQIKEPYRTVMRHFAVDGMSEKEIIEHLKVNPNTGKAWVQRGRKRLKDALPEYKDYL